MEKNMYLDLLTKSLGTSTSLSVDSIEGLLGHIADIHNTMGKSYEYLADVISSLIKAAEQKKYAESAQKKNKELEKEIDLLKSKMRDLENELKAAKEKTFQFEKDSNSKEEFIRDLLQQLEKTNDKLSHPQKDLGFIKSFHTQKEDPIIEDAPSNKKRLEDLLTPTPTEEITTLKRKYDEILAPSMDFDDENKSSSTTTNNNDDYKFKKVFKKVKRNENNGKGSGKGNGNGNSTSTPFLSNYNPNRKSDLVGSRTNKIDFDEDDGLEDLLGNFIATKEIRENSSKSLTNKSGKKDEAYMSVEKEKEKSKDTKLKEKSAEKQKEKPKEKAVLTKSPLRDFFEKQAEKPKDKAKEKAVINKTTPLKDLLEMQDNSKVYKKNTGLAFSQQSPFKASPLKSLELSDSDNLSSVPITRGGRSTNMMQKMLMGNKKRNSVEPSQPFRLSTKKDEEEKNEKKLGMINDEDLVRTSHRSKFEREGLQGFDCDQFL